MSLVNNFSKKENLNFKILGKEEFIRYVSNNKTNPNNIKNQNNAPSNKVESTKDQIFSLFLKTLTYFNHFLIIIIALVQILFCIYLKLKLNSGNYLIIITSISIPIKILLYIVKSKINKFHMTFDLIIISFDLLYVFSYIITLSLLQNNIVETLSLSHQGILIFMIFIYIEFFLFFNFNKFLYVSLNILYTGLCIFACVKYANKIDKMNENFNSTYKLGKLSIYPEIILNFLLLFLVFIFNNLNEVYSKLSEKIKEFDLMSNYLMYKINNDIFASLKIVDNNMFVVNDLLTNLMKDVVKISKKESLQNSNNNLIDSNITMNLDFATENVLLNNKKAYEIKQEKVNNINPSEVMKSLYLVNDKFEKSLENIILQKEKEYQIDNKNNIKYENEKFLDLGVFQTVLFEDLDNDGIRKLSVENQVSALKINNTEIGNINYCFKTRKTFEVYFRKIKLLNEKTITEIFLYEVTKVKNDQTEELIDQASKKAFCNIAHEFKTPLLTIISLINELRDESKFGFNAENRKSDPQFLIPTMLFRRKSATSNIQLVDQINSMSEYTMYLIEDIIYYGSSKLEQDNFNVVIERTNINKIVFFCDSILRSLLKVKCKDSITPIINMDSILQNKEIDTDEIRLKQILLNFISNAVKFTKKGGITLNITIRKDIDSLELSVSDTGSGIKEEDLLKIRNFNKENDRNVLNTDKRDNRLGTGLGINIAHQFCLKLGYEFFCLSKLNEGSTFGVLIPKISKYITNNNILLHRTNSKSKTLPHKRNNRRISMEFSLAMKSIKNIKVIYNYIKTKDYQIDNNTTDNNDDRKMSALESANSLKQLPAKRNKSSKVLTTLQGLEPLNSESSRSYFTISEGDETIINNEMYLNPIDEKIQNESFQNNKSFIKNVNNRKSIVPGSPSLFSRSSHNETDNSKKLKPQVRVLPKKKQSCKSNLSKKSNISNTFQDQTISENELYDSENEDKYYDDDLETPVNYNDMLFRRSAPEEMIRNTHFLDDSQTDKKIDRQKQVKFIYNYNNNKNITYNFPKKEDIKGRNRPSLAIIKEEDLEINPNLHNLNTSSAKAKEDEYNNLKKILVVDDDPTIRKSLIKMLNSIIDKSKFQIIEGSDGADIVHHFISDQAKGECLVKLVLSDESMEYINGSDAFSIIKNLAREGKIQYFESLKLVSVTGYDQEEERNQILKKGATNVISKPVKISVLKELMNSLE